MKRFGSIILSASLALTMTACGQPQSTGSTSDSFVSSDAEEVNASAGLANQASDEKLALLYDKMVEQVEMGYYLSATQTYISGGSALTSYRDAASYYTYASALFLYHGKHSSCLGQPLASLRQIPDFLSAADIIAEIETTVAPYEGVYIRTDPKGVTYRISIHDGLLSSEVMTGISGDQGNYQSQLILMEEADGSRMYCTNLNYTDQSDLNYVLTLLPEGNLEVTNADGSPYEVFVGTYEKTSDIALESR